MRGTDGASTHSVADVWGTALAESYGTPGAALTGGQLLHLAYAGILEQGIAGTVKTLRQLDRITTAATFTLDGVNPTNITRAT